MKLIWRYSRMFSLRMSIYFTLEKATLLFWSQPEERGLLTHYGPTPSNPCCCWRGWWRGRRRGRSRTSRSTPCRRPSSPPGFYSSPLRSASRTCRCRTAPDGQKKKNPQHAQSDHDGAHSINTRPRRKRPNNIHSERHACEEAEREHRQQQRPLFFSVLPLFFPRSRQAVRGALQRTVSVPKQRAQMNKLTAFMSASQRGFGKSEGQKGEETKYLFFLFFFFFCFSRHVKRTL